MEIDFSELMKMARPYHVMDGYDLVAVSESTYPRRFIQGDED
jgi:hypothetical protein